MTASVARFVELLASFQALQASFQSTMGPCAKLICFVNLDPTEPKFFGFEEFLAALALLVLAWTTADVRYRFRIQAAPIPLRRITFWVVAAVGVLSLATDLWRASAWPVPAGNLISPAGWQALMGAAFLSTFLLWVWYAFVRPATFGRRNAKQFAEAVYRIVLKATPGELAVLADELTYSAKALVEFAPGRRKRSAPDAETASRRGRRDKLVRERAHQVLLLMADKRFCRAVVESAPTVVLVLFEEVARTKRYDIPISQFARNIVGEAFRFRDSFIFHESDEYGSGLMGRYRPLSQALFGDIDLVEEVGTLLDPPFADYRRWDAMQWEAYASITLISLKAYVAKGAIGHSYVLNRAADQFERAASNLYKLEGSASYAYDDEEVAKLRVEVEFLGNAVAVLEGIALPPPITARLRKQNHWATDNPFDLLASLAYEIVWTGSMVQRPRDLCWWVQHNTVWGELRSKLAESGAAGAFVFRRMCHLLWDDVEEMIRFPNFKGARIIALLLNVHGLKVLRDDFHRPSRALHTALLKWFKHHFDALHHDNPTLASACLVDGLTYDASTRRVVKTYASVFGKPPQTEFFEVDSRPLPSTAAPAAAPTPVVAAPLLALSTPVAGSAGMAEAKPASGSLVVAGSLAPAAAPPGSVPPGNAGSSHSASLDHT